MTNGDFIYSGHDNLESMKSAINYNHYLISMIKDNFSKSEDLLDFGCGAGDYADKLKRLGFSVIGCEIDPQLRRDCRAKGIECFENILEIDGNLSQIYSMNVLEHIENDLQTLEILNSKLKAGGKLLIYVPAHQLLYSAMDRHVGHFRRYSNGSLKEVIEKAGFKVNYTKQVDSLGYLIAFIYRFLPASRGVISPTSVKIYDTFLFPISLLLDRVAGNRFGKNILLVAEKIYN